MISGMTIADIKLLLSSRYLHHPSVASQRLLHEGRLLRDEETLADIDFNTNKQQQQQQQQIIILYLALTDQKNSADTNTNTTTNTIIPAVAHNNNIYLAHH